MAVGHPNVLVSKIQFMIGQTWFKIHCGSSVGFTGRHSFDGCIVHHILCINTITGQWAVLRFLAVTCLRIYITVWCRKFANKFVIVSGNNTAHIRQAAITKFYLISVNERVQGVALGEVLIQ